MSVDERWPEVERVLDEVLEHDPAQWQSVLLRCAPDPQVRQVVTELLKRGTRINDFIARPVAQGWPALAELSVPPSWAGREVGGFRLVREIGRGGMGIVWLAHKAEEAGTQAAIKLMYPWVANAEVQRRFEQERLILESLAHPNIARLLGSALTDGGQICLILEYVPGLSIDAFCAVKQLDIRARLELVRTVAQALAHAHSCQIVHRDVKPSNILVTADGGVKLVDFGIAKVLAQSEQPYTHTGQRWATLSHAAPEQLQARPVTVATDIYQLGVVLYELLARRRIFEGLSDQAALQHAVIAQEPLPPSRAVLQAQHLDAAERRRLARLLRGELDAIVLKALRKEPRHRYHSAHELAGDISRFLEGLPVQARPHAPFVLTSRYRWMLVAAAAATVFVAGYAVRSAQASPARLRSRSDAELALGGQFSLVSDT